MNNWIFKVTNQKIDNQTVSAREIFSQRMKDGFWGLGERTPNRKSLETGDQIIFYIGNPERVFGGTAIVTSKSFQLAEKEKDKYAHDKPKYVPDLVPDLEFVENKPYWGTYFQGGIRGISDKDFSLIVSSRKSGKSRTDIEETIKHDEQFALEAHLEEFMYVNWTKFSWGKNLQLYKIPESDGRQFPAGSWSIEFLAVDVESNDFVVIELNRGQTSDATVGQVPRYMGWVRANLASANQKVTGIIVCKEIDDGLRYAINQTQDISVFSYSVKFSVEEIEFE